MRKVSTQLATMMLCVLLVCPSVLAVTMSESAVADAMARGDAATKAGDIAGAEAIYSAIVENAPNSPSAPEAMAHVGALQYKANRRTEAMDTYKALVQRYPDTSEAATVSYRMGAEHMHNNRLQDSQDAFAAAAANKHISDLNRGRALLQVGFVDMMKYFAAEYWNRAHDGSPILVRPLDGDRDQYLASALTQFETTRKLYAAGKTPGIVAVADAAMGEIYLLSQKPALAEEAYRKVLSENGPIPDKLANLAQYGLGQALYGQDNLEGALDQFDQALSKFAPGGEYGFGVAPVQTKADLHAWKVLSLYGLKRFDEALSAAREGKAALEEDAALSDQAASMELWEGLILCQMGKTDDGLTVMRNVITEHKGTRYATQATSVISQFDEGVVD